MISVSTFSSLAWKDKRSAKQGFVLVVRGTFYQAKTVLHSAAAVCPDPQIRSLTAFRDSYPFAFNGRMHTDCIPHIFTVNRVTAAGPDCTAASLWCVCVLACLLVCIHEYLCVLLCVPSFLKPFLFGRNRFSRRSFLALSVGAICKILSSFHLFIPKIN